MAGVGLQAAEFVAVEFVAVVAGFAVEPLAERVVELVVVLALPAAPVEPAVQSRAS